MNGLWQWIDNIALALFSLRGAPPRPETARITPTDQFLVGAALPFGTQAPEAGEAVCVSLASFGKHAAIFGASGSGKTNFIHRLRGAFIEAGTTVIDVDYRGDGFDQALARLAHLGISSDRVTLIDLRDRGRLTPLNFLGFGPGDAHSRAGVVYNALKDQAESWGVQLGPDLRACLIALAEVRGSLLDVPALLSPDNSRGRADLIDRLADDYARTSLETYAALPPDVQRTRAAAVSNKLDEFVCNPTLRASLSCPAAPDIQQICDKAGHITLVALGADRNPQAALIGRMFVSAIQRAAMARVDTTEENRNPLRLIVDEAQNLLGEESCQILAEGRRFRLGLVLSTQFAGSLSSGLRAAVKVNCATQIYCQTSASEANDIAAEVVSSLNKDEIRQTLLMASVGQALVVRKGSPAALVMMPESPNPRVSRAEVAELRSKAIERTTVPFAVHTRKNVDSARSRANEEVVIDERKPFSKPRRS